MMRQLLLLAGENKIHAWTGPERGPMGTYHLCKLLTMLLLYYVILLYVYSRIFFIHELDWV